MNPYLSYDGLFGKEAKERHIKLIIEMDTEGLFAKMIESAKSMSDFGIILNRICKRKNRYKLKRKFKQHRKR